ncbi:YfzA family protein [Heyndrickxia oleronia]|uniref:YfzA family protein n=1 Tax=Heyndrickxia oleronia TaxID=38875 RepID=UPI001BB3688C|nr:YfzA family protein [Heyndrickxia oleronia]
MDDFHWGIRGFADHFLIIDNSSWSPGFNKGAFFDRLTNSKFFTEWFTPYDIVQFNRFTVVFSNALFPAH